MVLLAMAVVFVGAGLLVFFAIPRSGNQPPNPTPELPTSHTSAVDVTPVIAALSSRATPPTAFKLPTRNRSCVRIALDASVVDAAVSSPSKSNERSVALPLSNGDVAVCPPLGADVILRLRGALDPSVHFRHSGCANVAWCDGHVTAEAPTKVGTGNSYGGDAHKWAIGWFGLSQENGAWNPQRTQP